MIARGGGVVVNVGSTAAFQPMPYFAVYGATKACVVAFGEALWAEMHEAGIRAVTICPGSALTPAHGESSLDASGIKRLIRRRFLTPEMVVAASLDAVDADKPLVVKRLAAGRVLYLAAAALVATLSRRRRMFVYERLNRWLLQGR